MKVLLVARFSLVLASFCFEFLLETTMPEFYADCALDSLLFAA
jgi:hypothetical protein